MTITYRPSGRFTLVGFILMLVFGLAGALLGSYISRNILSQLSVFSGLDWVSWRRVVSPWVSNGE